MNQRISKTIARSVATFIWLILTIIVSLLLAWKVIAFSSFFYPSAYKHLQIQQTIIQFAPENRNRHYFPVDDSALHQKLFDQISQSIQNQGVGLSIIEYPGTNGQHYSLLTPAEILHLNDVAGLIQVLERAAWFILIVWLILSILMFMILKWALPGIGKLFTSGSIVTVFSVVVIILYGPEKLFYAMHEIVFPPGHAWFFYYQDSLMTTLMKAPDLFAYIAAIWLVISLLILTAVLLGLRKLTCHRKNSP